MLELNGESVLYVSNEYYSFMAWQSWQHYNAAEMGIDWNRNQL